MNDPMPLSVVIILGVTFAIETVLYFYGIIRGIRADLNRPTNC